MTLSEDSLSPWPPLDARGEWAREGGAAGGEGAPAAAAGAATAGPALWRPQPLWGSTHAGAPHAPDARAVSPDAAAVAAAVAAVNAAAASATRQHQHPAGAWHQAGGLPQAPLAQELAALAGASVASQVAPAAHVPVAQAVQAAPQLALQPQQDASGAPPHLGGGSLASTVSAQQQQQQAGAMAASDTVAAAAVAAAVAAYPAAPAVPLLADLSQPTLPPVPHPLVPLRPGTQPLAQQPLVQPLVPAVAPLALSVQHAQLAQVQQGAPPGFGWGWGSFPLRSYGPLQPRGYPAPQQPLLLPQVANAGALKHAAAHVAISLQAAAGVTPSAAVAAAAAAAVAAATTPVAPLAAPSLATPATPAATAAASVPEVELVAEPSGDDVRVLQELKRCYLLYDQQRFAECAWELVHLATESPGRAAVLLLLGAAYYQLRDYSACIAVNSQLIQQHSTLPEAHGNLANALKDVGDLELSLQYYTSAIKLNPNFTMAYANMASAYMAKGSYAQALECYSTALRLDPALVDVRVSMGQLLRAQGLRDAAKQCFTEALRHAPGHASAWASLAALHLEIGDQVAARAYFAEAARLDPSMGGFQPLQQQPVSVGSAGGGALLATPHHDAQQQLMAASAYHQLGNAYRGSHMLEEAAACYMRALVAMPNSAPALAALAGVMRQQGRTAEAISCFARATLLDPSDYVAGSEFAALLKETGRVQDSIIEYSRIVHGAPHIPELHANLGSAFKDAGQNDEAIKHYSTALRLRPEFPDALANLVHSLQCVCDWRCRDEWFLRLEKTIAQQIAVGQQPSVQPFHAIAYPVGGELALEISRRYATTVQNAATTAAVQYGLCMPLPLHPARPLREGERLRVGYVSSDFGSHPLSHLMGSVFGLHDRERIEVFCYAHSPDDGTEWRARIESEAEHFLDVSTWSVTDIAKRISDDQIQVAVNLNGYTKGARNEIFALRPAPVQVSYMGFPSTTGADYIDYLVTDKVVSPPEFAHFYSEQLVYVPNCYFVNDYAHRHRDLLEGANRNWTRAMLGLPQDAVVYYCANQLYKIDPDTLERWCSILQRVPKSVLWLLRFPPAGEVRLLAEAAARGVPAGRIVFTDVVGKDDHIHRSRLADIFLDTPLCNAHTTGCDVLWAGVPMVTCPAEKMASRVAASLCESAGFADEMVVASMAEYEERAVELGNDLRKLRALQRRLREARTTCALFDTQRWVRNFDRALMSMWDVYAAGQAPRSFASAEERMNLVRP